MAAGKGPVLRILLIVLTCVAGVLTFGAFFVSWYNIDGEYSTNTYFSLDPTTGTLEDIPVTVGEVDYLTHAYITMRGTFPIKFLDGSTEDHEFIDNIKFTYTDAHMPALGTLYTEVTVMLAIAFTCIVAEAVFNSLSFMKHRLGGKFGAFCKGRILSLLICLCSCLALIFTAIACFLATSAPDKRSHDPGVFWGNYQSGCFGASQPDFCTTYTGVGHGPSVGWVMVLFAWFLHLPILAISIYAAVHLRVMTELPTITPQWSHTLNAGDGSQVVALDCNTPAFNIAAVPFNQAAFNSPSVAPAFTTTPSVTGPMFV